jgi:transposase, IS5 family
MSQKGFWDKKTRHQTLEQNQDLVVRLNQIIPWEEYRPLFSQLREQTRGKICGSQTERL